MSRDFKVEKVAAYAPGAIVGMKLRECCRCGCHNSALMHFVPCCKTVTGFLKFPDLDENGTPTTKLPNCPYCGEDELGVINPEQVLCYKCGWRLVRGDSIGVTT